MTPVTSVYVEALRRVAGCGPEGFRWTGVSSAAERLAMIGYLSLERLQGHSDPWQECWVAHVTDAGRNYLLGVEAGTAAVLA